MYAWMVAMLTSCAAPEPAAEPPDLGGAWVATLDSPGGPLRFGLELVEQAGWQATVVNGHERISVPTVEVGDTLVLGFDHYDSEVRATLDGETWTGTWRKRRGDDVWGEMGFSASRGALQVVGTPVDVGGTWGVTFGEDDAAIGQIEVAADGTATGTFNTPTGDYRYLAGSSTEAGLVLQTFDGAHAFLFHADLDGERLRGTFWSGSHWEEPWTAVRDDGATLPDAMAMTTVTDAEALAALSFPDLSGVPRTIGDFVGPRIVTLFGSWCPNCHDEAAYLVELKARYGDRLTVIGLAFELTDDFDRNVAVIRRYQARHGADWPVLVAGSANKEIAAQQFPVVDAVRSYPTAIFLRADGSVAAVHTGFSGPATGDAHTALRADWDRVLAALIPE